MNIQQFGKAIVAALGVAMVALEPQYGRYAWYVAIPAVYTGIATYMSAPTILPTKTVTVHSSQETQQQQ